MAKTELESILDLLEFQAHPQVKASAYEGKFSPSEMAYFRKHSLLSSVMEYPSVCKSCSNPAEVRNDGRTAVLVDLKNPRHTFELDAKEYEFLKLGIPKLCQLLSDLLRKESIIEASFKSNYNFEDEYFEVSFSDDKKQFSVFVLYGRLSKDIMYRILLDLEQDNRGFFILYPDRNSAVVEESLPFFQGQLLGMVNFSNSGDARKNVLSLRSSIDTFLKISAFEEQISKEIVDKLDKKFADMIKKVDTNPKYLLNMISRLQVYDKGQTTWMNFEKLVKLAMRYLFPGDITVGGAQDSGKSVPDSINFVRNGGKVNTALIVDAKRVQDEDLKSQKTEKYEKYVQLINSTVVTGTPKICIVFVAPSFGDISDFASRMIKKNQDVYICGLTIRSLLTILQLKLSFLLSSALEIKDSSLESFMGKLFDIDIVNKYHVFRNHYQLSSDLILEIMEKEGQTSSMSFKTEFEKIKKAVDLPS